LSSRVNAILTIDGSQGRYFLAACLLAPFGKPENCDKILKRIRDYSGAKRRFLMIFAF